MITDHELLDKLNEMLDTMTRREVVVELVKANYDRDEAWAMVQEVVRMRFSKARYGHISGGRNQ